MAKDRSQRRTALRSGAITLGLMLLVLLLMLVRLGQEL